MIVMVTKQSGFINLNIFETWKNSPIIPPSLKFLEQRVHELVGGPLNRPPSLDKVSGNKMLDQDGLKEVSFFYREGAHENWEDPVLFLDQKGDQKNF